MKKILFFLLFIPTFIFCQTWEKTIGGDSFDQGASVQQTTDGGYIITGMTHSFENSEDVYLIKTDCYGDTLWTNTFGGENMDQGSSVQQTTDGGYILTGWTGSFGNSDDVYLIKTDNYGDTLWTNTFGSEDDDYGYSVQQTTDGGYIIAGNTSLGSSGKSDIFLIKTDENGDSLWTQTYDINIQDFGYSVQQTTDGGFVLTGWTGSFAYKDNNIYLIKTDNYGDSLWIKTYGGDYSNFGYSVQQTTDEGYIITGSTDSFKNSNDVYLIKTDSYGNTLWTKTYGKESDNSGYSVQQTTDEGYIITGFTSSLGIYDVYLIKTDSYGDTLWTNTFGGAYNDIGNSVQQTTDGGYIITGSKILTEGGSNDVYLIKTNENGIITSTIEIPFPNPKRKLIKTIDLSGIEIIEPRINQPHIDIYDDGSTEKKIKLR